MSIHEFNLPPKEIPKETAIYHTSKYYPYPEPKQTFRLNPLVLNTLKNVDVDDVQDIFGKGIQDINLQQKSEKVLLKKLYDDDLQIRDIRNSIKEAEMNKYRALQIRQNQALRMQKLVKDTEADEQILEKLEREQKAQAELDAKKAADRFKAKYMLQEQMKEKERLKEEGRKEYERDKKNIEELVAKLKAEDLANFQENERKKAINKMYMENAYAEKERRKQQALADEEAEKEAARKYYEEIAKRENELNQKKAAAQSEKDKIFDKLCAEKAAQQAEKDYWENVRNELYQLQEAKKDRLKQIEEEQKRQRQKEDMLNSAIEQMKLKALKKKEEQEMEENFKKKLAEKFKEDEKLELLNIQKRKEKEEAFKAEVEKMWKAKLDQFKAQKAQELQELEDQKREEEKRRYLLELEKKRLIEENEELLKKYYPTGYYKSLSYLSPTPLKKPDNLNLYQKTKFDVIYNNIFGNSNPNPPEAYPKWGKIKNFVYDIDVQEVNHNINRENHLMYNATLNNDYDSYPTQEEYKAYMDKIGQKNYSYCGGPPMPGRSFIKFPKTKVGPQQIIPQESYFNPETIKQNRPKSQADSQQQIYAQKVNNYDNLWHRGPLETTTQSNYEPSYNTHNPYNQTYIAQPNIQTQNQQPNSVKFAEPELA
jgi:hypothetical protein